MASIGQASASVVKVDCETAVNAVFLSPPTLNATSPMTSTPLKVGNIVGSRTGRGKSCVVNELVW